MIETAVALLIMTIAGLGVASLFLYSTRYNTGGNERAVALALAQEQIEITRGTAFQNLTDGETTEAIEAGAEGARRRYQIITTITDNNILITSADVERKEVRIRVTPQAAGGGWASGTVELRTFRSLPKNGPNIEPNPTP